jgi:glycosyltransferase involved in cell wall biosynthesis
MTPPRRIAFIGNHLPRRCGIATFTHDLHAAVAAARPDVDTGVIAMNDPRSTYDYPDVVRFQIAENKPDEYVKAAEYLNSSGYDVVSLQHEYGIFGGDAGSHILGLLDALDMPVVTTLHTVLTNPSPAHYSVMRRIINASSKLVVMSQKGRDVLSSVHGVPDEKIEIIAHGIPDFPFVDSDIGKAKFGFSNKTVLLTFGLLSPNKGVGTMIDAMPEIIKSCPNAVYVVLGATHPNLVREQGEQYREQLFARVKELGIEDHVVFVNRFVDQPTLLDYISMCDIYVTPYLSEAQMTSGTLAYSFGLGKPVVSTPYWHAKELLEDGRGILVPFGDAKAIGTEITALLTNDVRRNEMRARAYSASRSMTWAKTAEHYLKTLSNVRKPARPVRSARGNTDVAFPRRYPMPEVSTGHFLAMCDSTGLMQHAVHSIPDRVHGYCVDDNARALLLTCALGKTSDGCSDQTLPSRFASFIQHAWNPDTRRFRNFMSYDRRWLEDRGSEDSHARTLWALGVCAADDRDSARRGWAAGLFKTALPVVEELSSPRAWAFTLLGLNAYCAAHCGDAAANVMRKLLADRLLKLFEHNHSADWPWFEHGLTYDNARLSQALIATGLAMHTQAYVSVGLKSLRWLMAVQTAPSGCFRPVGSDGFELLRQKPAVFDQQPVEAAATISACLTAYRVDRDPEWQSGARRALEWFLGNNDLMLPLINQETGGCMDGLHWDRPNLNMGAESVVSYLLGLLEMRQFKLRAVTESETASAIVLGNSGVAGTAARQAQHVKQLQTNLLHSNPGGPRVSIPISASSEASTSTGPSSGRRAAVQTRN